MRRAQFCQTALEQLHTAVTDIDCLRAAMYDTPASDHVLDLDEPRLLVRMSLTD